MIISGAMFATNMASTCCSPKGMTSMTFATVCELPASLLVMMTRSEMSGAME